MSSKEKRELTAEEIESIVGGLPELTVRDGIFKCENPSAYIGQKVTFRIDGKEMNGTISGINVGSCYMCSFKASLPVTRYKSYFFGLIKKPYTDYEVYKVDPGNFVSFKE